MPSNTWIAWACRILGIFLAIYAVKFGAATGINPRDQMIAVGFLIIMALNAFILSELKMMDD